MWELDHTRKTGHRARGGSIDKNAKEIWQHQVQRTLIWLWWIPAAGSYVRLPSSFLLLPFSLSLSLSPLPPPLFPTSLRLSFLSPSLHFPPSLPPSLSSFLASSYLIFLLLSSCVMFLISFSFSFLSPLLIFFSFCYSPSFTHNLLYYFCLKTRLLWVL